MAKQDNPIARLEYSGPIPPASELEQYNKAFPKAAEIILSMAVEQSAHRREIEKSMMKYNFERSRLGLAAAFTLSLSALVHCLFKFYRLLAKTMKSMKSLQIGYLSVFVKIFFEPKN